MPSSGFSQAARGLSANLMHLNEAKSRFCTGTGWADNGLRLFLRRKAWAWWWMSNYITMNLCLWKFPYLDVSIIFPLNRYNEFRDSLGLTVGRSVLFYQGETLAQH